MFFDPPLLLVFQLCFYSSLASSLPLSTFFISTALCASYPPCMRPKVSLLPKNEIAFGHHSKSSTSLTLLVRHSRFTLDQESRLSTVIDADCESGIQGLAKTPRLEFSRWEQILVLD